MNILTFDIEDWYNCDFISQDFDWDKYEVRLYDGIERILSLLDEKKLKGTFFCLGWVAEKHPDVIKRIHQEGHHVGCHSYQHELSFRFDQKGFRNDTERSKKLLEDLIGKDVNAFRAPGFSITESNTWSLDILAELGFKYDCSLFPAEHDYGGFPSFGKSEPVLLSLANGMELKEFPINFHEFAGKKLVYSGGGFFRLFPYFIIKNWAEQSDYVMTYFHTRDFDPGQPMIKSLPLMRKFKSYVGLKQAFPKFQKMLIDFDFVDLETADSMIDWTEVRKIELK
jgi:polysaccharide deacetylase family protein (PEP-CTERM system associated)